MRPVYFFATMLVTSTSLFIISCGGKDNKKGDLKSRTETTIGTVKGSDDGMVPAIDTGSLKDEASILDAIQKVVDARIADEKKRKEDPAYRGHLVELMILHTAVLKASVAYSQSLNDPTKSIEFGKKFGAIEEKLYPK